MGRWRLLATFSLISLAIGVNFGAPVELLSEGDIQPLIDSLKFRLRHSGQNERDGGVKADLPCRLCEALIIAVRTEFLSNTTEAQLGALADRICIRFHIEDTPVCKAVVNEFRDELFYIVSRIILDPSEVCSLLTSKCPKVPLPTIKWDVKMTPNPKPPVTHFPTVDDNVDQLRVLHLSDIHFDVKYKIGADVTCGEPLCCRNITGDPTTEKAQEWGYLGECDTPIETLQNLFDHLKEQKFDYVIMTGDLPPHDIWSQTRTDQITVIRTVVKMLRETFPNTPVFPSLGNHESAPVNSFAPHIKDLPSDYSIDWLYNELAADWGVWVNGTTAQSDIRKRASYEVDVLPGFRIISINTNMGAAGNFWLYINGTDPDGLLDWLIGRLQNAEDNNIKVHIIGHIPSGDTTALKEWSRNFYEIVNRYESTIRGLFYGHTHYDGFTVYYDHSDPYDRATNIGFVTPSVTTFSYKNPSYRVYNIDGKRPNSTFVVTNHETFFMDVEKANQVGQPEWIRLYNAKIDYNMADLSPQSWSDLILRFMKDPQLLDKYVNFTHSGSTSSQLRCDLECRRAALCAMRSGRARYEPLCRDIPILLGH